MRTDIEKQLPVDLLIESSIDAMIAIGTDDLVRSWNKAASVLFDRSRDDMIGEPLFKELPILKEDQSFQNAIEAARKGKKSFLPASDTDFAYRSHVEIRVIPLQTMKNVVGVMILVHDVSHRIAKEEELRKLNEELQHRLRQLHLTSRELNQLTHIATHNIKAPIREIYTTVENVLRKEAQGMSNGSKAAFRRIQSSLNKMNLLLDDIVTLTQINITEDTDSVVNISEVLNTLRTQFDQKLRDAKVNFTTGELENVRAQSNQILLLLQQIFSYVIKFAHTEDPRIHVSSCKIYYTAKDGEKGKSGEYHSLSITHNSTAFDSLDPETRLQVSGNVDIRNYTGPAIALAIVGKIMDVHAGFLTIEKATEGYFTIKCFFPVNDYNSGKFLRTEPRNQDNIA